MNYREAFSYLDIPITKDVSEIKKSYQNLVSLHHPEEDQEGFMRLHQAYKSALAYAQEKKTSNTISVQDFQEDSSSQKENDAELEYDSIFSGLDGNAAEEISQDKDSFSRKLLMLKLHWLPIPLKRWLKFFSSKAFLENRGDAGRMEMLLELMLGI